MEYQQQPKSHLRHLHEFIFSFNLALVVTWARNQTAAHFWGVPSHLQFWINDHLHLPPHSGIGGYAAFLLSALEQALCIFVLLRLLSSTSLAREALSSVAGLASMTALPAFWLDFTHRFPQPLTLPNPPRFWLFFELAAALACILLYRFAKWPLAGWGSVMLLILHHGFWGWLFLGGPYFWLVPFQSLFPIVGLFSSLAWGLYVSEQRRQEQVAHPVE